MLERETYVNCLLIVVDGKLDDGESIIARVFWLCDDIVDELFEEEVVRGLNPKHTVIVTECWCNYLNTLPLSFVARSRWLFQFH